MAKKKKIDPNKKAPKQGENFDDLEDAFFATGDASSFWEKADASQLDDESQEVEDITDVREAAAPLDEASESIAAAPVEEPAVEDESLELELEPDSESESKPVPVPVPTLPPIISVPEASPAVKDPSGEFYNPSALHPSPDLIADDETEVWSEPESADALLNAPTVIYEPDDDIDPATEPAIEAGMVADSPPEPEPPAPVDTILYVLPETTEGRWKEAALALERSAGCVEGDAKATLLRDSARILLTRVGSWETAGALFDSAIEAGLDLKDTPKGYADVVASQGRFVELRDLLLARATSLTGAASIEAYQDAAIVERNHLKDDTAAVQFLHTALEIQDDWFTLRLLRELYYRTRNWTVLVYVLDRMTKLSEGACSARCKVEEGRIREVELSDLDGAVEAYQGALDNDPTYMDGFLARLRVAKSQNDGEALVQLYVHEGTRTEGANRAFWAARAARASRDAGLPNTGKLFRDAIGYADAGSNSIHRDGAAFFISQNDNENLFETLAAEAKLQTGTTRAATLLLLGQVGSVQTEHLDRAVAHLTEAVIADPACWPAARLAIDLLVQSERAEAALEMLSQQLEAVDDGVRKARILFRQGEINESLRVDFKEASSLYAAARDADPSHPFAATAHARNLELAGEYAEAADVLEALASAETAPDRCSRLWHKASKIRRDHLDDSKGANSACKQAIETSALQPAAIEEWIASLEGGKDPAGLAEALASAGRRFSNPLDRLEANYRAARVLVDVCHTPQNAAGLLQLCVEIDTHCQPAVALFQEVSSKEGDWQTAYDLSRVEAGMSTGQERMWHLIAAAHLTSRIDGQDAQTVALEVLDEQPNHPAALAVMERAAIQAGDPGRLIGVYRRMRKASGEPAERTAISVRLAGLAAELNDRQLALRSITHVLESPAGPRPYGAMARLAVSGEFWALAEAALHADGDEIGLARLLESTCDDQKRVATAWRTVIKSDPKNLEAYNGLERSLTRMSNREGLADTHAALAKYENEDSISTMHALLAGHLYENEEAFGKAVQFYGLAFERSQHRGKAFEALIRIYSQMGRGDTIRQLFEKVEGDDIVALADALADAGDAAQAANLYKEAVASAKDEDGPSVVLPLVIRYEQALIAAEKWPLALGMLKRRLLHSADPHEIALVEAKQRWLLSERMADSDEAWEFYRHLHEEHPNDSEVLENLARIAGARGESKLAIQFLDGLSNIATTAEDAARYQRRVAEVHLTNDAAELARAAFLRALDHNPSDVEALTGLKGIAEAAEDWQGLVGVLTREYHLLSGEEQVDRARTIAGLWEDQLGDTAVAIDSWRKVTDLVPGDETALTRLVALAESIEDWASFIDVGEALVPLLEGEEKSNLLGRMGRVAIQNLRRDEEAIRFLDAASSGDAPNLQAAEDLEQIHAARGAWDRVVECIIRRAHGSEGQQAVSLLLRAAQTRVDHLRDRKGASSIFDEILELEPANPTALEFKGDYLYKSDDLVGAVKVFEAIEQLDIERDLEDFDIQMEQALYYFHFGEALRRLQRRDDAVFRYEQALKLNGSHLPSLEAVGPLYVAAENWDLASRVFRQVLQLTGGQGDPARLALVYACLGKVEHAQGNPEKAARRFNKALELQPNGIEALQGHAKLLYERGDWNNLLTTYNSVIYHAKERDAFIDAYLMKGFVLDAHMSLPDKASQHYEKSLSFDATNPLALLRLGELALRKDDWDRAASFAGRALAIGTVKDDEVCTMLHCLAAVAAVQTGRVDELETAQDAIKKLKTSFGADVAKQGTDADKLHALLRKRLKARP
jgi:tetratricopeptide (TPR) repeat protein